MLTANEKASLRELALRYANYAALPIHAEKAKLWEALNTGHMMRPMVLLDQLPWNEIDPLGKLNGTVADPYWSWFEHLLRHKLYQWEHFPADMVLPPYLLLPSPARSSGYGIDRAVHFSGENENAVRAQSFECLFNTLEDVEKIQTPHLIYDREQQARITAEANELFDGIIGWRFEGITLHMGIWDYIAERMGVTNVYMALYDDPDLLHAMMERFTEATLSLIDEIDAAKAANLYDPYCHCSHTFLPDDARSGNVCKDGQIGGAASEAWGFGLAQLFTSVSPDVTEEFEVAYMKRLFPRFKHIYYGCCDRLDDRMDRILQLPNVRKISCSPWSNADVFAERIPKDLVMSAKPNPAFFAAKTFDLDAIRTDLRAKIAAAKRNSANLEFIFKDVSTVNGNPQILTDTAKAAVELMEEEYA